VAVITLIEAIKQAMDEELARDPRVFITGEDVGKRGGVFRATQGLYEKYGENRIVDSPLAELSIVAVGIGAALAYLRPICEIQFADFSTVNQMSMRLPDVYYRPDMAGADGDPCAVWGRHRRGAVSQPEPGGVLRTRAGTQGGHSVNAL
jgi:pyruvate/2-oxoglutarate/acetoin dehydrogenase E1 component